MEKSRQNALTPKFIFIKSKFDVIFYFRLKFCKEILQTPNQNMKTYL